MTVPICQRVFKMAVCEKDQSETSRMMSHSARRLNQLEHVSVVVRMVTGLVSVKVVKVIQVEFYSLHYVQKSLSSLDY